MTLDDRVYWSIVRKCLERFHGYSRPLATREVANFRKRMKSTLSNGAFELMFHTEPLYIAEEISGHELPSPESSLQREYDRIVEEAQQRANRKSQASVR